MNRTRLLWTLGPVVVLAALLWPFVQFNPLESLSGDVPPLEQLSVERITLGPEGLWLRVVNAGPEPVTLAQVMVDEAYWAFSVEPGPTLPRLGRAQVVVPYPWVEGEAHEVRLVTSTGTTFDATIEVAVASPRPQARTWLTFALLGAYVGIVPVGLGLLWFPLLRGLRPGRLHFFLALTVGLLVFLLVDTVLEALEIAETVPAVFQAAPLVVLVGLMSFLTLNALGRRPGKVEGGRLRLATLIALGIGLHNLGEGLSIGAAVALGEAALGTFLVVGFTLHNLTEGLGIGAPLARSRPGFWRLAGLALLAGGPAILGTWIGGLAFSPLWAVLFLAVGAGAILQVVVELTRLLIQAPAPVRAWTHLAGLSAGLAVMYLTALLVKF